MRTARTRRILPPGPAILLAAALVLVAPGGPEAAAQEPEVEPDVGALQARTARAVRRQGALEIDGRLDEQAWLQAPVISGFVQTEPVEGADPEQPTEVRVLFDEATLYVGARLYEDDPSRIADQLVRRDQPGQYDYFEVGLDPNLDRTTGYLFIVGAAGVERDAYLFDDTEEDEEWNAVWNSAVHRDSVGWTVEMEIPLSQIRYEARRGEQAWGVNFLRRRLASNSISSFSLLSRTVEGQVSQFGRLEGLRLPEAASRLEVEPYALTEYFSAPADPNDPLFDGTEIRPRAGADVSYGLGASFGLDATFNPDFGQVEVDPAVINLTAFETFFPEKRPFFVQDARIFDFELSGRRNRLFFSRRIGREPHGSAPPEADFAEVPRRTTILGAAKLTGRTAGGLSVGGLVALTDDEHASVHDADSGTRREVLVEPLSQYGVGRVQKDFRDGASRVGAMLTAVNRDLPEDASFDRLTSSAYALGIDFEHNWGGSEGRDWVVDGFVTGSLVNGAPEALVAIQTDPNHYFQRPDADDLRVDSTATSMTGVNWRLQFERQSAEHWTWAVWLGQVTPGFEIDDLGFSTSGQQLDAGGRISYREIEPGSLFRDYRIFVFTFHNWRHTLLDDVFSADRWAQSYQGGGVFANSRFTFLNNWSLEAGLDVMPESLSDTETRGGPLMTEPAAVGTEVTLRTDDRKPWSIGPTISYTRRDRSGGYTLETGLELSFRPSPAWEVRLQPTWTLQEDAAQYVATTGDVGYAPTYGARYLFSDLERRTLSMETRLNVTFSPELSLQLFLQPLLSSGDYVSYKQLVEAETFRFDRFEEGSAADTPSGVRCEGGRICVLDGTRYVDFQGDGETDYSFRDRDFNVRSLRGNAVLRWEYASGSTLFLVWQQNRRADADLADFDLGRDLEGLFDAPAENTFIVKVSHFLDL